MGEPRGGRACGLGDCAAPGVRRRRCPARRARLLPRDKPCGGGITGRALRHAPCSIDPVIEDEVHTFELRLGYGRSFVRRSDRPLVFMTQRRRLDTHLAERAAAAGAGARPGARVDEVSCENGHVTARLGRKVVRASVVVGADGANGIVAKSAGLGKDIMRGIALEGNVAWGDLDERRHRGQGAVRRGRRPGRLRLGLSHARTRKSRRRRLGYRRGQDFATISPVWRHRMVCLSLRRRTSRAIACPRGAREGASRPAASFSSVTQPGWSTRSRATASTRRLSPDVSRRTILSDDLTRYQTALEHELDSHLRASWVAKQALDRHPHVVLLGRACPMGLRGGCRPRARRPTSPERSSRRETAVALDRSSRPLDPAGPASNVEDLRRA